MDRSGPCPRILFVTGKGGVGRSTVATALGLAASRRGARALLFEWTLSDPIAPWFGLPAAMETPVEVAPGLHVVSYSLDEALRAYFVDHLHMPRFYRRIVMGRPVRAFLDAAPGIAELLFLGTLWWLTTLAEREAGLAFDRIVVDTPATGHGASILELPDALRRIEAGGLLAKEVGRVTAMMRDPEWTGAVVVTTADELAVEESAELLPRLEQAFGRPALAVVLNRSVSKLVPGEVDIAIAQASSPASCLSTMSRPARDAFDLLVAELAARSRAEERVIGDLAAHAERGVVVLEDVHLARGAASPRDVVEALHSRLFGLVEGA